MNAWLLVVLVVVLSAATGAISKTSDLFNDDGLEWFTGSSEISGVLWAVTGSLLITLDAEVGAVWAATVMYWFLRRKLDHFNHAFAGVCIGSTALATAAAGRLDVLAFALLLGWLTVSGYLNTWLKASAAPDGRLAAFLRLRLRYYAGPVVLGIVTGDALPALSILAGMLGTELVTAWGRRRLPAATAPDGTAALAPVADRES